ncbi:MAG: ribonuclease P protein component [Syntrophomonadaceae bacterium]|jgi:ribonuclease P protein component|nr:ribonuclease P protein component [Syntrophomonadaceae bacterium]
MIGKEFRIRESKHYNNIYQNGKKYLGRYLVVFILKNDLGINRFGIVTSKKIGNAIVRNKAKRRLRAVVDNNRFNLEQGYDFVLVSRPLISKVNYIQIEKDFISVMRKTGIC